jgi:hypothetical protein
LSKLSPTCVSFTLFFSRVRTAQANRGKGWYGEYVCSSSTKSKLKANEDGSPRVECAAEFTPPTTSRVELEAVCNVCKHMLGACFTDEACSTQHFDAGIGGELDLPIFLPVWSGAFEDCNTGASDAFRRVEGYDDTSSHAFAATCAGCFPDTKCKGNPLLVAKGRSETRTTLLKMCEGDCNLDADCEGDLVCQQRWDQRSVSDSLSLFLSLSLTHTHARARARTLSPTSSHIPLYGTRGLTANGACGCLAHSSPHVRLPTHYL